ncbi:MAG TPA: glycosyltransferase, partial [Usitatibacter sp.]|nr:glycosyltransferase [Usitatibacter sp.]
SCAVLHVTSLPGGGVDRHVRDIVRALAAQHHLVWHTAESADAVEIAAEGRLLALDRAALERDPGALARWLKSMGVGLVHVHSVSRAARRRARWAAQALRTATLVTLHDVLFLRADGFEPDRASGPDREWLAETARFLKEAAAVLAPSDYLAELARHHIEGLGVVVVPNGSAAARSVNRASSARPEFLAKRPRQVVAVLGAIGPHKGRELIEELAQLLRDSDIAIVVIGYLDTQLSPGWRSDRLFVHGAYDDEQAGALLAAYGAQLALFPNRVPESFSYALSDVWAAGIPALVAPSGALAERVGRHGGGWLLPQGFDAHETLRAIESILSPPRSGELARVNLKLSQPDNERVPPLDAMTRSLDALYARFGIDPDASLQPDSAQVQRLLATNLDGALFRKELARLADEFAQVSAALESARQFETEARAWIAKLEGDIAAVQAELGREVEDRRALGQENVQLRIHKAAFDLLPEFVRKLLLKKIHDARS